MPFSSYRNNEINIAFIIGLYELKVFKQNDDYTLICLDRYISCILADTFFFNKILCFRTMTNNSRS